MHLVRTLKNPLTNLLVMTTLHTFDGHPRVYRRKNERFADSCVIERNHFGVGNIMVW